MPDSPALDSDRDGRPDPDLPSSPFFFGGPEPEVELKLYFAQFGNGTANNVNLFSQDHALQSRLPANSRILLKDNAGNPLAIELGGETVEGKKRGDTSRWARS